MTAVTLPSALLRSFLTTVRLFLRRIPAFIFMIGLTAAGIAEAAGSKKDPIFDEDRIHKVSVFSFMQSLSRGGKSYPVLVTLNVRGPKNLTTFCDNQPKVNEAVLGVLSQDRGKANKKAVLRAIKMPLRKAVNRVLTGKPVRKVVTRAGRTPAEFGPDLMKTKRACKAIHG